MSLLAGALHDVSDFSVTHDKNREIDKAGSGQALILADICGVDDVVTMVNHKIIVTVNRRDARHQASARRLSHLPAKSSGQ